MRLCQRSRGTRCQELITGCRTTSDLARVDALHTALTQIVLEGGDLAGIAGEVARALDVGVLVTSTDGRERARRYPTSLRERLAAADLVDPTGRFRVERRRPRRRPGRRRPGAHPPRRRRRHRPGPAGLRPRRRPVSATDVQALERASDGRRAADDPRAGGRRGREQVPAATSSATCSCGRAGDEQYVVEHALGVRLGAGPSRGRGGRRARPGRPGRGPASSAQRRQWQERFSAAWRQVTATLGDRRSRASTSPPRW